MNKLIIIMTFLLLVLLSTIVAADTNHEAARGVYLGGQGGLNMAGFGGPGPSADPSEEYHYGPGYSIGVLGGIRPYERFAAQIEIMFFSRKPSASIDGMDAATYHLNFLDIPVTTRFFLPRLGGFEPYGLLGPSLGILLRADLDYVDGTRNDVTDRVTRIDFGLLVGIGASIQLGRHGAFSLNVRYNHGLRDFQKTSVGENREFLHRAIYFTVSYQAMVSLF